ncbi:MAG TPA: PH domain-containing protein [Burkholderiales bacterium]
MTEAADQENSATAPLWRGHPSHWRYFWWWVVGVLLLAAYGAGLIVIAGIFIARARHSYMVTPRLVMIEEGLVAKSSNEVRIHDVRSINMAKRGISGLFGVGDLEISSAATDKAEIIFHGIPHASQVRDLLRQQQGNA